MEFKQVLIKRLSLGLGLILILVILLVFLGRDISSRVENINAKQQDLSSRLRVVESLASLRKDSVRAGDLFKSLQGILPTKDQLFSFSKTLESFAKSNQLGFGFSFGAEISGTKTAPGINDFTLTSGGGYANLVRFLKLIEESKYFVSFDSIDLLYRDNNYSAVMRGKVFSQ